MQTVRQIHNIDQNRLGNKMRLFLAGIGESLPKWATNGLCNGYSVMLMRADLIDERDKHLQRLYTLSEANDEKIKKMAKLYLNFKAQYRKLVSQNANKLQQALQECKTEEDIQAVRKQHYAAIENQITAKLSEEDRQLLAYTRDLYIFINSLLAAHDPEKSLGLEINNKKIAQEDLLQILYLLPPDAFITPLATEDKKPPVSDSKQPIAENEQKKPKFEIKLPIQKAFEIQFNFTEQELVATLKQVLKNDDFVQIGTTTHAMYFCKRNDRYIFYDPNGKKGPEEFKSCEDLVDAYQEYAFTNFKRKSDFMCTGFYIFEKLGKNNEPRPSPAELARNILQNRRAQAQQAKLGLGASEIKLVAPKPSQHTSDTKLGLSAPTVVPQETKQSPPKITTDSRVIKISTDESNQAEQETKVGTPESMLAVAMIKRAKTVVSNADDKVNAQAWDGTTSLHMAARAGNLELVVELLVNNADPTIFDVENMSAILLAAAYDQLDTLKILREYLESYTDSDTAHQNSKGRSLAHVAAVNGSTNVLQWLAEQKTDFTTTDKDGSSPLTLAMKKNHWDAVVIMLTSMPNIKMIALPDTARMFKNRDKLTDAFIRLAKSMPKDDERTLYIKNVINGKNALGEVLNRHGSSFHFFSSKYRQGMTRKIQKIANEFKILPDAVESKQPDKSGIKIKH